MRGNDLRDAVIKLVVTEEHGRCSLDVRPLEILELARRDEALFLSNDGASATYGYSRPTRARSCSAESFLA
jgi:hypothetical protein